MKSDNNSKKCIKLWREDNANSGSSLGARCDVDFFEAPPISGGGSPSSSDATLQRFVHFFGAPADASDWTSAKNAPTDAEVSFGIQGALITIFGVIYYAYRRDRDTELSFHWSSS